MYFKFWRRVKIHDNKTYQDRIVIFLAEMTGSAILMFIGCGACVSNVWGSKRLHLESSIGFGLSILISVQTIGHVSLSHINPIVTICSILVGKVALIEAPVYFMGELVGAFLGFGLLRAATPSKYIYSKEGSVCSPSLSPNISELQGLLVEFFASSCLLWTVCGVWDKRNADKEDSVPIKFGLIVAVLALTAGPYTGCHINPTRTLAPAVINNSWNHHWIYWVGPFSASFFAPITYTVFFAADKPEEIPSRRSSVSPSN